MIITTLGGRVVATAESIEDVALLMALRTKPKKINGEQEGKPHLAYPATRKPRVLLRQKRACPICGKRVKMMEPHIRWNHRNTDVAASPTAPRNIG